MRRLPRILLNAATAVSLALCVLTLCLWVRTRYATDMFTRIDDPPGGGPQRISLLQSAAGAVAWAAQTRVPPEIDTNPTPHGRWVHEATAASVDPPAQWLLWRATRLERAGFLCHRGAQPELNMIGFWYAPDVVYGLPYWSICTLFALPAIHPIYRGFRRRRARRCGLCPACGYDLRATPDRCPECGSAVS